MMTTSIDEKKSFITARNIQLVSVLFGLLVSGYLSYLKITDVPSVCIQGGPFNCSVVLNSVYSEFAGIPIAYLGFLTYVIIGVVLLFENRVGFIQEYGRLIVFGVGLFAWMFSMWLVFVQFFLLQALCPWCLSHEANFTILFGFICYRLYKDMTSETKEEILESKRDS
jgi:uncharacterized membrane protein